MTDDTRELAMIKNLLIGATEETWASRTLDAIRLVDELAGSPALPVPAGETERPTFEDFPHEAQQWIRSLNEKRWALVRAILGPDTDGNLDERQIEALRARPSGGDVEALRKIIELAKPEWGNHARLVDVLDKIGALAAEALAHPTAEEPKP